MVRALLYAALALVLGCRAPAPPPTSPEPSAASTPSAPSALLRRQLFFSGRDDEGPVLAALVLQWQTRPVGAVIEAKGFVVARGALRAPFYERTALPSWPGEDVPGVLEAWRAARSGDPARIAWVEEGSSLDASVRGASGAVSLGFEALAPAGQGTGPHGPLSWRAGRATLSLDGAEVQGVGVVEQLRGHTATPSFGRFEMWLLAPSANALVLGRRTLGGSSPGQALRVDRLGRASTGPFDVEVSGQRLHQATGFELPTAWRLPSEGDLMLSRSSEGEPVTGVGGSGGPAIYDIGLATSERGPDTALVFHLQDR